MEILDDSINDKPKGNMLQNTNSEDEVFANDIFAEEMDALKKKQATTMTYITQAQFMQLFELQLQNIYWAEKTLTTAIPKMIAHATSMKLIETLTNHLTDTENQIFRLENIFLKLCIAAHSKKCEAMAGLINEAEELMAVCEPGAMKDAGIIAVAQKVEHYEMSSYSTLIQFAESLKLLDCVNYLGETLREETASDALLNELAISAVEIAPAQ